MKKAKMGLTVTLAQSYNPEKHKVNDGNWWWSEKLDGVRAYWNPDRDGLFSRADKEFTVPEFFKNELRKVNLPLDGELFFGRGEFQECVSIVRKKKSMDPKEWAGISFEIFDVIDADQTLTFTDRHQYMKEKIGTEHGFLKILRQTQLGPEDDVMAITDKLVADGAEGLMLKKGDSVYEMKRSWSLLKVKKWQDCEATVLEITKGKGKNSEVMGQARCVLDDGVEFLLGGGFTDSMRKTPPFKIGSVVTVKFFEKTKAGKPRFPIYIATRDYE